MVRHPAGQARGVISAAVGVERLGEDQLQLVFQLRAAEGAVLWPIATAAPARRDELWRSTCCELFVCKPDNQSYREWNFSPSGDWQSYAFEGTRRGRSRAKVNAPLIEAQLDASDAERFLKVQLKVTPGALQLGLSMVIADSDGGLDYWALAHSRAKPDFHASDSWTLRV